MAWGRRNAVAVTAVLTAALAVSAAPAGAASTIGSTFAADVTSDTDVSYVQSVSPGSSYAAPAAGVITSWSHLADATPGQTMRLKVVRRGAGSSFTVVGQSDPHSIVPGTLNTFQTRIPVAAGDVIGIHVVAMSDVASASPGHGVHALEGDPAPGSTTTWNATAGQFQIDVSATLEPDCDGDGLGDETQDPDIGVCPPGPTVTITDGPKRKVRTRKKRAKVKFEFTSNEQGATFSCTLDGTQKFKTCASPFKVKVKRGAHTFSVVATDVGGNQGAPAADSFKVKRKKK